MVRLHELAGGFRPIAGPLEKLQEKEWRIDILRPIWLDQVEHTKTALSIMAEVKPEKISS